MVADFQAEVAAADVAVGLGLEVGGWKSGAGSRGLEVGGQVLLQPVRASVGQAASTVFGLSKPAPSATAAVPAAIPALRKTLRVVIITFTPYGKAIIFVSGQTEKPNRL